MLRKTLVLCLVCVIAAGPWLCCCTAKQIAQIAKVSWAVAEPAEPALTCCCCPSETFHEEKQAPEVPAPPDHKPCPCQEDRAPLGILSDGKTDFGAHERASLDQTLDVFAEACDFVQTSRFVERSPVCWDGPRDTCRDRLTLLHILIC